MNLIFHNNKTGKISLYLDGVLRPFPDMDTFSALYTGELSKLGKVDYDNDSDLVYPFGPTLNKATALYQYPGKPDIYLADDLGTGNVQFRHIINWQTFAAYGFDRSLIKPLESIPTKDKVGHIVNIPTRTLYHTDLSPKSIAQPGYMEAINQSGFTTLNIFGLSVTSNGKTNELGDLTIGGELLVHKGKYKANLAYADQLNMIKRNGVKGSVNKLMFTIGGWDWAFSSVYEVLQPKPDGRGGYTFKNVDLLTENFKALKQNLPCIDGIDIDNEDLDPYQSDLDLPSSIPDDNKMAIALNVQFAKIIANAGFSVTFCPYEHKYEFWEPCLKKLNTGKQYPVEGLNLQCYAGGLDNIPGEWASPDAPNGFVFPGLSTSISPDEITAKIINWKSNNYTPKGGFIWPEELFSYSDVKTMKQYAKALVVVPAFDPKSGKLLELKKKATSAMAG